ncbi:MAG: SPOR domain-containing protein [Candidatus Omnitrophota bacterium]
MNENKMQTDLFEANGPEGRLRGIRRIKKQYPRQRFLSHIPVPIEQMVIGAITILFLVIVAYAIGVEKGRSSAKEDLYEAGAVLPVEEKVTEVITEEQGAWSEELPMKDEDVYSKKEEAVLLEEQNEIIEEKIEIDITPLPKSGYILQLASFKNEDSAEKEMTKLKNKGFSGILSKTGSWYQVYIEGYKTIDEAKKSQKELSEEYKDCYIRRVRSSE